MQTKDYMRSQILNMNSGWLRIEEWEGSRRGKSWSKRVIRRKEKQNRFVEINQ